ncbi:MAG: hypothetical protein E7388_06015 [Ruminococcaceae bacterium]|nr:hypothetical protein [Oscillospiraceae bacterium]
MSTEIKKKKKTGSLDNNKFVAILAVSLAVIVVFVSVLSVVLVTSGNFVAKLNGQKLYNYEYVHYLNAELADISEEIDIPEGTSDEKAVEIYKEYFTKKDENGKYALQLCQENALEELRIFKASYQLALDKGFKLTSEEADNVEANVDYMINYYYSVYQQYDSSITYEDVLQYVCGEMSAKQYKEYAKQDTVIAKYMDSMKEKYDITEAEMRKVYDENVNDYRTAKVQKFFLSTMTTDKDGKSVAMKDAEKADVKAKIDDYLAKFKSGELKFEETIKSKSEETNAAKSAGISTINNGSLSGDTKVDEWALKKEKADAENVYEVIEAEKGYYIIRCNEVEDFDNSVDSEEGANDSIKNTIKAEIATERATKQMRDEALAAKGYDLSNIKDEKIAELFEENKTVSSLVSDYGAKISD